MASQYPHPRVGIAAIIYGPDGKLITGKRMGSHGAGTWQLPGGHLEYGEDPLVCAERETREETGLAVRARRIAAVENAVFEDVGKHYITLFVLCDMVDEGEEPRVLEPEKCAGWYWKTWEELREFLEPEEGGDVLFLPLKNLVERRSDFGDLKL